MEKKTVKNENKTEEKIPYASYEKKEDIVRQARLRALDHIADVNGLETLAACRGGLMDASIVSSIIEQNIDLFHIDYVDLANTEVGAFHARVQKICIARSNTERKGLRATLIVKTEQFYNDKENKTAGKETWREYRDVYPCDSLSELVRDVFSEMEEALFTYVNNSIDKYNDKLECKGKCEKGCKCSK